MKPHPLFSRRYLVLLVFIVLSMILSAFFHKHYSLSVAFSFFWLGVMAASLWSVAGSRFILALGIMMGMLGYGCSLPGILRIPLGVWTLPLVILGVACLAVFVGIIIASILWHILHGTHVTLDTILGGVCIYFLLGFLWAFLYDAADLAVMGGFLCNGSPLARDMESYGILLHFSFMTLTTVGYGDVVPANSVTRTMADLEAVLGQIYMAVFVARLDGDTGKVLSARGYGSPGINQDSTGLQILAAPHPSAGIWYAGGFSGSLQLGPPAATLIRNDAAQSLIGFVGKLAP